jgi:hypothetical protein
VTAISFENDSCVPISKLVSHCLTAHWHAVRFARVSADNAMKFAGIDFYMVAALPGCSPNLCVQFVSEVLRRWRGQSFALLYTHLDQPANHRLVLRRLRNSLRIFRIALGRLIGPAWSAINASRRASSSGGMRTPIVGFVPVAGRPRFFCAGIFYFFVMEFMLAA